MATVVFRCPNMGVRVQGWFADNRTENGGEIYNFITCNARWQVHLVNKATGRVLGVNERSKIRR
jgi:hypothetical protein